MKKYYLYEPGNTSFKRYTLEEILEYFGLEEYLNDEEYFDPIAGKKWVDSYNAAWNEAKEIGTVEAVQDFINNFINHVDGMHYHDYVIEEC